MTGRLSTRLIANHPAVQVGLVFGAGMVHGIIYTSIAYVQRPDISALYNIGVGSVPAAFYTALITPFVYFALAWLFPRPDSFIGKLG
jgi:hypothetical protein